MGLALSKYKYQIFLLLFLTIFVLSLVLKVMVILNNNFPFTMDQARDMLDIRNIVVGHHLTLIGPTTSINGVFLGPFWYYFNVIPFILGSGHPATLVYWMIFWFTICGFLIWWVYQKTDRLFGLVFSVLFLMVPTFYYASRYSWNANSMPFFTVFFFLALISNLSKPSIPKSLLVGLLAGLSMQIQAAFGVLFFPFVILIYLICRIKFEYLNFTGIMFFLTLLPQIFFEIRHQFVMTRTFLNEVFGTSAILGEKLNFSQTFALHLKNYVKIARDVFDLDSKFNFHLSLISIVVLSIFLLKKRLSNLSKTYFITILLFIIFSFLFYMLYRYPLKGWFILGLYIPFLILIVLFFVEMFRLKHPILSLLLALLITFSFINTYNSQIKLIPKPTDRSTDKSNLRNEIEVIDWVYQKANGQAFKAYNYIPSVYDFPYNYLYWWHGTKTYSYQPAVLTYLDNVPSYIPDNEKFLTKKKPASDTSPIFLIIEQDEMPDRVENWLGNFKKYCLEASHSFTWPTTVQIRRICS